MSWVGAGGSGGGRGGGGGRDDKLKKKIDDTLPFSGADSDENDDEQVFPDVGSVDEDAANPASDAASVGEFRGVRRYAAGDGSYRTTYVSCINSRDSPHNNRQIWLGRYYELKAAAMAYDVFAFYIHHDTFVNFPELLHLYTQFIPRRGLQTDGTYLPITASDLERIKHIGLGIIRAFYPDSCAAIHTRRNQKALPGAANYPALTAQQRQTAAALQAVYHTQIEERTRTLVLEFIANQQPLAQQLNLAAGEAGPSSTQGAAENAAPPNLPLHAASLDFSSVQIPSQTTRAPAHDARNIEFPVPQHHAPIRPLASTSVPRLIGHVRQASTSPDTLRQTSSQHTDSSNALLQAYNNFFAQNPFAQFASPSQISPDTLSIFRRHQSSPQITPTQASHVSRPAPTRARSLPAESPFLRSLGIIPDALTNEHQERPHSLIRSNIARGSEEGGLGKGVSFEEDKYNKAAEARLYAERLRTERLNNQAAANIEPGTSSFPLVQRIRELSKAPYDQLYGAQQQESPHTFLDPIMGSRASPKKQRSSEPLLGAHADLLGSLQPGQYGPQRRSSAFSSYKATDTVQGGTSRQISSLPDAIPIRARQPGDYTMLNEEEDQRVVPLRRQAPEELSLFDVFKKQATAAEEMATGGKGPSTSLSLQGPSTSNVQASYSTSFHVGLSEQEGTTHGRPISTELTLARGELGPPFVRAPLVPDLNIRAPDTASEALRMVSSASAESPQDHAPINIRELQRVSTLLPSWQGEGPSSQQQEEESSSPAPPYIIQPDKSKQEEDKGKGKE